MVNEGGAAQKRGAGRAAREATPVVWGDAVGKRRLAVKGGKYEEEPENRGDGTLRHSALPLPSRWSCGSLATAGANAMRVDAQREWRILSQEKCVTRV